MICNVCGKNNPDNIKFCSHCGNTLVPQTETQDKSPVSQSKLSFKTKIITAVALSLFVIIGTLCTVITTPEYVTSNFFDAVITKNWGKMYKYIDVEKSEFVSKKAFVQFMENSDNQFKSFNTTDFVVSEPKKYIQMFDINNEKKSESVTVKYFDNNSQQETSRTFQVNKKDSNKYLLFNNYKVSTEGIIAKNFKIYAPDYIEIRIDGKKLKKKYISDKSESGYLEYTLPDMFTGKHELKARGEIIEDFTTEIHVSSESDFSLSNIKLKADQENMLAQISEAAYKEYMQSVVENKGFENLTFEMSDNEDDISVLKDTYNSMTDITAKKQGYGLKSISFGAFFKTDTPTRFMSDNSICFELSFKYTTVSTSKRYNGEIRENTSREKTGSLKTYFIYDDGEYVIKNIGGSINY